MASHLDDKSQWRLSTTGGIKYKFLGMNGSFSFDTGSVMWRALIASGDLVDFLEEIFPPPTPVGNMLLPITGAKLPGLPTMVATNVDFKAHETGLPIDPFGADSSAASRTYGPAIEVAVTFKPFPQNDSDPNDPFTFLEISANATGEFINSHMPNSKWDHKEGTETVDEDTGEVTEDVSDQETVENRSPTVPVIVRVPQTEWTLRWPQIQFDFFHDVMIHRLRILMGRVNSNTIPVLFNAYPETCLFVGYTLKQDYTWRQSGQKYQIGRPPVTVEMKIREKRVVWNGSIRGHNDVWRPGFGWETLLIDGENKTYREIDYGLLFKV